MTDDLRGRLNVMATNELVAILECRDLDQWRPEAFPLVDAILKERGEHPARADGSHTPRRHRGTARPPWARGVRIMLVGVAVGIAAGIPLLLSVKLEEMSGTTGGNPIGLGLLMLAGALTGIAVVVGGAIDVVDSMTRRRTKR